MKKTASATRIVDPANILGTLPPQLRIWDALVVCPSGKPLEAPLDQPLQAVHKMVAPKEVAAVDPTVRKVLDLLHLLDEAVAGNGSLRRARKATFSIDMVGPAVCGFIGRSEPRGAGAVPCASSYSVFGYM